MINRKKNDKQDEDITFLQGVKIIIWALLGISIPVGIITFILTQLLNISLFISLCVGIGTIIVIIFAFGLYKPINDNNDKKNIDDFD